MRHNPGSIMKMSFLNCNRVLSFRAASNRQIDGTKASITHMSSPWCFRYSRSCIEVSFEALVKKTINFEINWILVILDILPTMCYIMRRFRGSSHNRNMGVVIWTPIRPHPSLQNFHGNRLINRVRKHEVAMLSFSDNNTSGGIVSKIKLYPQEIDEGRASAP